MKKSIKIFRVFVFFMFMYIICSSNVYCTTTGNIKSGNIAKESLDVIPNEINIDCNEIEYYDDAFTFEKVSTKVYEQVVFSLNEIGFEFDTENNSQESYIGTIKVEVWPPEIKKAIITITDNTNTYSKEVILKYKNSQYYSNTVKKYVENKWEKLNFNQEVQTSMSKDTYFRFEYDFAFYQDIRKIINMDREESHNKAINIINEQLKDTSIKVIPNGLGMGGGSLFSSRSVISVELFYKDIQYSTKDIAIQNIPEIIVPEEIDWNEEAYIAYAIPIINDVLEELNGEYELVNLKPSEVFSCHYEATFKSGDKEFTDLFVIRKENEFFDHSTIISSKLDEIVIHNYGLYSDTKVELKIANYCPELILKAKEMGYNKILGSFSINFTGIKSLMDLSFSLSEIYNNNEICILFLDSDGQCQTYTSSVINGNITGSYMISPNCNMVVARKLNVQKGDTNLDNLINSTDAALVLDLYKNNKAIDENYEVSDMNDDLHLNATDSALILDLFKNGHL